MVKYKGLWAGLALVVTMALPVVAEEPGADTVVATVNGTEITLGHMIMLREALSEQYKSLPDDVLFKGILDQLVQQVALEQSLGDNIAKRDVLTLENDRRGYLSGIALNAIIATAVTDTALQAAYDARFMDAAPETEFNAAHILVDTEEKAAELKAQIDAGADFAELAKANSSDGAAQNGGDLGWFGLGMMVKPFEDAVVTMKAGEVMGPVKTNFGWHLIQLKQTRIASAPSLDDLREELAAEIEAQVVEAHVKGLTDAATITRPGESLDPALLQDLTLLDK